MKAKSNKIIVEIVSGGYCECGCKGRCDIREIIVTKNGKSKTISSDLDDLLKQISKQKYFKFEIKIIN